MKRRIIIVLSATMALIALLILFIVRIPVIGSLAHENRIVVTIDEPLLVIYETFDNGFNVSDKGAFAGICRGNRQKYMAYYVKGDTPHEYLYVDDKFFRKVTPPRPFGLSN